MKSGETAVFKTADCTPMNRSSLARVVSDLTLLDDMSPQLILHCLKKRFSEEKIYTNVR
jgi:myosin heavy subunit